MSHGTLSAVAQHYFEHQEQAALFQSLRERFAHCRSVSVNLCDPLATEDYVIQTIADVSPPKWHLAHTTWFFETFLLKPFLQGYVVYHPKYDYLFNSYYETVGRPFPRPQRGWLARPTVAETLEYRRYVEQHMLALLEQDTHADAARIAFLTETGIQHEQQHQELLLTDIKHIFAQNPLWPEYLPSAPMPESRSRPLHWLTFEGGLSNVGYAGSGFAYDNELPQHRFWLEPFAVSDRLISNGEYLEFMAAGGYDNVALWLSDAWKLVKTENWQSPLYWQQIDGDWWHMTLHGMCKVDENAPVCHVSFYEADAYARWCNARLPSEQEWEFLAAEAPIEGNFADSGLLHPLAAAADATGISQLYGDVWEWTQSAYLPYPGFQAHAGALGEYNGKFMANQMVLRGGSCFTWQNHMRSSYRNFFYAKDQWQMSGFRLARSVQR